MYLDFLYMYKHCNTRIGFFFHAINLCLRHALSCVINECFVIMTFKEMNANTKKQVPVLPLKITTGFDMDNII